VRRERRLLAQSPSERAGRILRLGAVVLVLAVGHMVTGGDRTRSRPSPTASGRRVFTGARQGTDGDRPGGARVADGDPPRPGGRS